ncbi:hypothetical protein B0H11DRAFT_1955376 [Mycena galericulata]|nr:hypothetical protein B0H11DRAFT_1955376 [Mycena galericulata]
MPHRSVRPENLSKLPASLRILAKTAVNGTVDDLQAFLTACITTPYSQPGHFLPVFLANVDPDRIPSLGQIDAISRGELDSPIDRALLSLYAIAGRQSEVLHAEASLDVWPSVWKWIEFLDAYRQILPGTADQERYTLYMSLISQLQKKHPKTKDLIDATPGVRVVLARAWSSFVRLDDCVRQEGFRHLCEIMLDLKMSNPTKFGEVIEGAGGDATSLAFVIIKHIKHSVAPSQPPSALALRVVIELLDETDADVGFKSALLSSGIVKALTSTVCLLTVSAITAAARLLNDCLTLMSRIFTTHPAPMCLPDALRAGLLRAICGCIAAHASIHRSLHVHMQHLLQEIIPPAMIYYSVVSRMGNALTGVGELGRDPRLKRSNLFKYWTQVVRLAEERIQVCRDYDAGKCPSRKACDNTECETICDKGQVGRCAACQRLHYCSLECQTFHWRQGGHRAMCGNLHALRLKEPESLSTRDRSFMRALVRRDYLASQSGIFLDEIEFLREFPNDPYYLQFDYTGGAVKIEILPTEAVDVSPTPSNFEVQWLDHVARAERSHGKMRVAVLRFVQANMARFRMISLHSGSSDVSNTLHSIAEGIPAHADYDSIRPTLLNKVRALAPLVDVSI